MTSVTPVIARVSPNSEWQAIEGEEVVGSARSVHRPDRRWFIALDYWRDDVGETLLKAIDEDLRADLYTTIDGADGAQIELWSAHGFTINRRQNDYLIPTDPEVTGLRGAAPPTGFKLRSAASVDETRLRALDEVLREDVPGTDGWVNDPQEFHEYTFHPGQFDPETYQVAVHEATHDLAGLARIWMGEEVRPRLGLIGVVAAHRRRGLARSLLAAAFAPLHERGLPEVTTEADATNAASIGVLTGIGARRTGGTVELLRRSSVAADADAGSSQTTGRT